MKPRLSLGDSKRQPGVILLLLPALLVCLSGPICKGEVILEVTGRLSSEKQPWEGQAEFRFVVMEGGAEVWRSHKANAFTDGWSGLSLPVSKDGYKARLGDTQQGMPPLPETIGVAQAAKLRVWYRLPGQEPVRVEPDLVLPKRAPPSQQSSETTLTAVLKELRLLRQEVGTIRNAMSHGRAPAAPKVVSIPLRPHQPRLGHPDAPFFLVEFTDLECGFCRRFDLDVLPGIQKNLIDSGQLQLRSAAMPLPMHENATRAAAILLAAHTQKEQAFWKLRPVLHQNAAPNEGDLRRLAIEHGLDGERWLEDINSPEVGARISSDKQDATQAGIQGTPSFVLGALQNGRIEGFLLVGAPSLDLLEAHIAKLKANLNSPKQPEKPSQPAVQP